MTYKLLYASNKKDEILEDVIDGTVHSCRGSGECAGRAQVSPNLHSDKMLIITGTLDVRMRF